MRDSAEPRGGAVGLLLSHRSLTVEAVADSARAPLSARHALRAAVLIDHLSDLAFAARGSLGTPALATARDLPAFRAALRQCEPSLGPIMDLTACGLHSPRLQVMPAKVASEAFPGLTVADLMVSLYNSGTVLRLMLVPAEGNPLLVQPLLQAAMVWWAAAMRDLSEGAGLA